MVLRRGIPWWVWAIAIGLAAIEPLTYAWIAYFPPEGAVPTGLRTPDGTFFIHAMRMFQTGFVNPYATCKSPHGIAYAGYFAVPFMVIYGVLGVVGHALGIPEFLFLGLVNGAAAFAYLLVVYQFLREVAPPRADRAFLLFSLGGGLGGGLYLVTGVLGLHETVHFDAYFLRFALYELFEGPALSPVLQMPRLYYTLALSLCVAGLTAFIRAFRRRSPSRLGVSCVLMAAGAVIHIHFGVFACVVAVLFLTSQHERPWRARARWGALLAASVAVGCGGVFMLLAHHPSFTGNALATVRQAVWLTALLSAGFFHLFIVPGEVSRRWTVLSRVERVCACAALGYLAAFGVLFLAYQTYYGNLVSGRDAMVPVVISDWALIGAALGCAYAMSRPRPAQTPSTDGWIVLWLLLFLALGVSAFGQGWFLRFVPQRLIVFLGLPICILSAAGLDHLGQTRPTRARALLCAIVACGVASIAVASLCFQGPFLRVPGQGPYADFHYEVMRPADAHVLDRLGEGTVLAPSPFGDILSLRSNTRVVFGRGSADLGPPWRDLEQRVRTFFSCEASEESRRAFVEEWCVDYVYCPDTWPVDPTVVEALRRTACLREIAHEGRAILFAVVR